MDRRCWLVTHCLVLSEGIAKKEIHRSRHVRVLTISAVHWNLEGLSALHATINMRHRVPRAHRESLARSRGKSGGSGFRFKTDTESSRATHRATTRSTGSSRQRLNVAK